MISRSEAMTVDVFHYGECVRRIGPRGGVTERVENWRRNGKTQTWKTRPDEYRIPVKYGMYNFSQITPGDDFHTAHDCPLSESE
jgi:hypothetical protein